jgi:hypothetical protein
MAPHLLNALPLAAIAVEVIAESSATLRCRSGETIVELARKHLRPGTQVEHVGDRGTLVVPRWLAVVSGMTDRRVARSYGHA